MQKIENLNSKLEDVKEFIRKSKIEVNKVRSEVIEEYRCKLSDTLKQKMPDFTNDFDKKINFLADLSLLAKDQGDIDKIDDFKNKLYYLLGLYENEDL